MSQTHHVAAAHRVFDVVIALVMTAVTMPLWVLAVVGIKLSDPGPVVYRATRVGRGGESFTLHKFRTMRVAREAGSAITSGRDPRIYPFGMLLRKTKVDELPQLFDVLRGAMSIVGPRPEDPGIVREHYQQRWLETLEIKPGLTSPGTLYYFTHEEALLPEGDAEQHYVAHVLPRKMELDLVYLRRRSVGYDFELVSRTALVVLSYAFGRRSFPAPKELSLVDES